MKRRKLIKHLEENGCEFVKEGAKHTKYRNPKNNKQTVIPRHIEIDEQLAKKICKDLEIQQP